MRIGSGAGFAGDRLDPARRLLDTDRLDYLVYECLAERTIALRQLERNGDPRTGYDPLLVRRIGPLLERAQRLGTRIVTNSGAANPRAAGEAILAEAVRQGLRGFSVAVVTGDDVLDRIDRNAAALETGEPLAAHGEIVSANAYLGADALLPALATPANVIVTGRVADPSLFAAPILHTLGWDPASGDDAAAALLTGHLLECAGQVTGGYFADPGMKDVPGLEDLGFPIAEIGADRSIVITKPEGTGGTVDLRTVKEQVLYEVLDPRDYVTPDGRLDLTGVRLDDLGADRVAARIGPAAPRPAELKVNVGYRAGHLAEAEISYAGRNAVARARLAAEIVTKRLDGHVDDIKADVIGIDALHGDAIARAGEPYECRLRVAGRDADRARAQAVGEEVTALYTNGPAGGGGVRTQCTPIIGVVSTFLPRAAIEIDTDVLEGPK